MAALTGEAVPILSEGFDRQQAGRLLLIALGAGLVVAVCLSLAVGPTGISLGSLPRALGSLFTDNASAEAVRERLVLLELRLPRTLLGLFVGAGLAVSGAMLQGLFRNPLADPALVGVSSGAALAAAGTIAFGNLYAAAFMRVAGVYAVSLAAFSGGVLTTVLLVSIAARRGQLSIAVLLLMGIAVAALADALRGIIVFASDDRELRDLTLWSLGSLAGAGWPKVFAVLPFALVLLFALPRLVRALNGFLLGEDAAFHLGIDTGRAKWAIVILSAAAVGAAVAVAGIIGFVGLVVPHLVRLVAGPDHRVVMPASACLGATLLVLADIVARMVVRPAELPLGIVMAVIGAPMFLQLVMRRGAGAE